MKSRHHLSLQRRSLARLTSPARTDLHQQVVTVTDIFHNSRVGITCFAVQLHDGATRYVNDTQIAPLSRADRERFA